jgi:hypothetical protein
LLAACFWWLGGPGVGLVLKLSSSVGNEGTEALPVKTKSASEQIFRVELDVQKKYGFPQKNYGGPINWG